ncbi:MAG: hypothetical protein K9J13_03135 [Saprospiraceae bacterium]|nr:hypothetical protein [Saprospiraceae bacterium]
MIKRSFVYKTLGVLIIILNCILVYDSCHLLYLYNFTTLLFFYMFPTFYLSIIIVLGIIGAICGFLTFKKHNEKPLKYVIVGFLTIIINIGMFLF